MIFEDMITRLDAIATERYPMITNLDVDALNDAKTIIDKYQKIQHIVKYDYGKGYQPNETIARIKEILEDEK